MVTKRPLQRSESLSVQLSVCRTLWMSVLLWYSIRVEMEEFGDVGEGRIKVCFIDFGNAGKPAGPAKTRPVRLCKATRLWLCVWLCSITYQTFGTLT